MNIDQDRVVSIHYTLRDDDGKVLDSSSGRPPLAYLHGNGNLIRGLESALAGRKAGERVEVTVPPEEGYGARDETLVSVLPRARFGQAGELAPGMQFQAQGPRGSRTVTIVRVERDLVTVDANHPLAGKTLHFEVEVADVRKATRQEIEHGHVHGPGGHAH